MAVFQAYSDEGGGPGPRDEFLISGYAASVDAWVRFSRAWAERVLEDPSIPYLHMTEIRREDFKRTWGVGDLDASDKVAEAARIIASTGELSVISAVMRRADFEDILHFKLKANSIARGLGVDRPDYICFLVYCMLMLRHVHSRYPNAEKVDFVVSEKKKVTENLEGFHNSLREFTRVRTPELTRLVGDLIPARMETRIPLQAADLFCWHLQRHYQGTATREDSANFRRLTQTIGHLHPYTAEDLNTLADKFLSDPSRSVAS